MIETILISCFFSFYAIERIYYYRIHNTTSEPLLNLSKPLMTSNEETYKPTILNEETAVNLYKNSNNSNIL